MYLAGPSRSQAKEMSCFSVHFLIRYGLQRMVAVACVCKKNSSLSVRFKGNVKLAKSTVMQLEYCCYLQPILIWVFTLWTLMNHMYMSRHVAAQLLRSWTQWCDCGHNVTRCYTLKSVIKCCAKYNAATRMCALLSLLFINCHNLDMCYQWIKISMPPTFFYADVFKSKGSVNIDRFVLLLVLHDATCIFRAPQSILSTAGSVSQAVSVFCAGAVWWPWEARCCE